MAVVAAVLAASVLAAAASADTVVVPDNEGRQISFDVQAPDVDVEWYANLLRSAAHGDEISTATIRIVAREAISGICGVGAAACYRASRGVSTLTVPAGNDLRTAHALIHEYGHHLDQARAVAGVREPNGTPAWWVTRGMQAHFASGRVASTYILGWDRSVAEIFAEDYVQLNMLQLNMQTPYGISWLSPPDSAVLDAIRADVAGVPVTPPAPPPPLELSRSGTVRAGAAQNLGFELLGPGRRVTLRVTVGAPKLRGVRSRLALRCGGTTVATRTFARGRGAVAIDHTGLGPGNCVASLRNTSKTALRYTIRLRLTVET